MSTTTTVARPATPAVVPPSPLPPTPAAQTPGKFEDPEPQRPQPAPATRETEDPDDLAYAAAKKAVDDIEAGATGVTGPASPGPTSAPPPARTAQPVPVRATPGAQPAAPSGPMIPKARFDEVNNELAYFKGVAAAHGLLPGAPGASGQPQPATVVPTATPPAAARPHPNTLLHGGAKIITDAATAYENGEMTLVEWTAKLFDGLGMIHDGRDAITLGQFRKDMLAEVDGIIGQRMRPGPADQAILDQQIGQIIQTKVWVGALNKAEIDWLQQAAMSEAKGLGKPYGTTPADTMRLREHVADLAEIYGPRWHPEMVAAATPEPTTDAPAGGVPANPTPQPPAQPAARPGRPVAPRPTAQQVADKVVIAASFPPAGDTRGGARQSGEVQLEDVPNLTQDELDAMPASSRRRLLGLPPN